jgi:hypothetical protein
MSGKNDQSGIETDRKASNSIQLRYHSESISTCTVMQYLEDELQPRPV